jgi:hypothetical protein
MFDFLKYGFDFIYCKKVQNFFIDLINYSCELSVILSPTLFFDGAISDSCHWRLMVARMNQLLAVLLNILIH